MGIHLDFGCRPVKLRKVSGIGIELGPWVLRAKGSDAKPYTSTPINTAQALLLLPWHIPFTSEFVVRLTWIGAWIYTEQKPPGH
jgi:hypothetical protein